LIGEIIVYTHPIAKNRDDECYGDISTITRLMLFRRFHRVHLGADFDPAWKFKQDGRTIRFA
jgi:phage tail sheath gpL-like